jgi:hypothetical protein
MFFHWEEAGRAVLHRATSGTSRLAAYQAALNHRQSSGFATSPRRTGFAGMYLISA